VLALSNPASADVPAVRVDLLESPSIIFDGDAAIIETRLSNLSYLPVKEVVLYSSSGESTPVGTLLPFTDVEVYLYITEYQLGTNELDIYATYSEGQSDRVRIEFNVRLSNESITLRIVDAPTSIYEGMDYTPKMEVQNLRSKTVAAVRIIRGTEVLQYLGPLAAYETRRVDLQIQEYALGDNSIVLAADHEWGVSQPVTLQFTVRPAEQSIALRVTDAPTSIYEGMAFVADLEIQNLRPEAVSWLSILSEEEVLYSMGTLLGNEVRHIEVEIREYDLGENIIAIFAEHEWGSSEPIYLEFSVMTAEDSVALKIVDSPASIYEGEVFTAELEIQNLQPEAIPWVHVNSAGDTLLYVGSLAPNEIRRVELRIDEYQIGHNSFELVAEHEWGTAQPVTLEFVVGNPDESIAIRVVQSPTSIYSGGIYEAQIEVHNLRPETVPWVTISSNNEVLYYVGSLAANELREIQLRIEEYEVGTNEVKLTAEHQWGRTYPLSLKFEVRRPGESVALRIIQAPVSIYEGEIFEALIEVKNLRLEPVSRIFIKNGNDVVYYVGALDADEEREIELQLIDYMIGENQVILEAESESGHSKPILLEFDVIAATTAVRVYLASSNSPVYVAEDLQFSVVIAAPEDADITELELRALDERVRPSGYYLGEQVAAQEEIDPIEIESMLALTQGVEEEEEPEKAVKGRELNFNARVAEPGSQSFDFQVSYRLGSVVVRHEFVVSAEIISPRSVKLIQADRITVSGDEETTVTLHVANGLPFDVEAVSVVPVGNTTTSPSEFFVGQMAPDDFLPAFFKVPSEELKDCDELFFKVVYRVGRQTYESTPLRVAVEADRSEVADVEWYIIPLIILAVIALVLLSWRVVRFIQRKRMKPHEYRQ
jgi:ubiquitin-protein ligase